MLMDNGFHPDLTAAHPVNNRVHLVKSSEISSDTGQSAGMQRFAAVSGRFVGSEKMWMGEATAQPQTVSGNHHHGDTETAIYVLSGHPQIIYHDGEKEVRVTADPGDYVFVPPYLPHREENPDPEIPARFVIARSSQEAVVVHLDHLYPLQ
ncbi:cupin domain-containing protein [Nocardia sp. NPDC049220]|uniref:cupin domain-containing protein n=1 Tax=Nocardia sp. NPDC049220 TaxID=3155273 RepID=UPI0033CD9634